MRVDISVIEWPDDPESSGPRLLGRLSDADMVDEALSRLERTRLREITRLRGAGVLHLAPAQGEGVDRE